MTTEDKIKYIEGFIRLIAKAEDYEAANSHAFFTRGIMAAWHTDLTISSVQYSQLYSDIDTIMEVKRKLPVNRKELF